LRMKRAAFVEMLGKKAAAEWSAHTERRSISPRSLPRTIRGVAVEDGEAGEDNIVMMLDRYTLLYGTKTVWDADKRIIVAYDAMSLARGSDLTTRWLEHRMRREIDLNKLVFDPTQKVDLDTHINMFGGLPLQPKKDDAKAGLAVALLESLVSGEGNTEAILHWVLCWLAFPLQHPGAKMQTAILFFGEKQGTGKSLFFEGIVKPIFGEYGATGGQHQLDAQYTQWRSQKLFVLFEEILSRQDKYSHFGLIKHMITGRDQQVTQKFKDDRSEDNHMNVVMLSNEFQAVPIEPNDRRFLVNEASTMLDENLRLAIKRELEDGMALSAAFYAFLLDYPLGDFEPHTKPLMTPSKEKVINFGRPDWEAFYLTWAGGELSVPYCSCLSEDLYVIYARYCNRFGFRALSLTKFAELIAQRVKKDRQWVTLGSAAKRLLTVFHVPQPEDEEPMKLSQQCERFRNLAEIKGMV
jgi:putative DNA primase/helicase